jgi:hypothetical protein
MEKMRESDILNRSMRILFLGFTRFESWVDYSKLFREIVMFEPEDNFEECSDVLVNYKHIHFSSEHLSLHKSDQTLSVFFVLRNRCSYIGEIFES